MHRPLRLALRLGLFVPWLSQPLAVGCPGECGPWRRQLSSSPGQLSGAEAAGRAGKGTWGGTCGVHRTLGEGPTSQHQESHTLLGPPLLQPSTP